MNEWENLVSSRGESEQCRWIEIDVYWLGRLSSVSRGKRAKKNGVACVLEDVYSIAHCQCSNHNRKKNERGREKENRLVAAANMLLLKRERFLFFFFFFFFVRAEKTRNSIAQVFVMSFCRHRFVKIEKRTARRWTERCSNVYRSDLIGREHRVTNWQAEKKCLGCSAFPSFLRAVCQILIGWNNAMSKSFQAHELVVLMMLIGSLHSMSSQPRSGLMKFQHG